MRPKMTLKTGEKNLRLIFYGGQRHQAWCVAEVFWTASPQGRTCLSSFNRTKPQN